jgi:transposase
MASAYSQDLRDRVIDAVLGGGMSRRAAAARFCMSKSSAIYALDSHSASLTLYMSPERYTNGGRRKV